MAFPALECQRVRAPACCFHNAPRDDQSQTGAAVFACHAAVRLLERLEDTRLILAADADAGVRDRKCNGDTIFVLLHGLGGDGNAAVLGELDRVARQIDQHLPQTGRVAADSLRQLSPNVQFQRQPLLTRAVLEHVAHGVQQRSRVEHDRFKRQRTRFDLGKVQNLIDQLHQRLGRGVHTAAIAFLLGIQRRALEQIQIPGHRAERCTQFMAHLREKFTFCPIGAVRFVARLPHLLLGCPAVFQFAFQCRPQAVEHLSEPIRFTRAARRDTHPHPVCCRTGERIRVPAQRHDIQPHQQPEHSRDEHQRAQQAENLHLGGGVTSGGRACDFVFQTI